MKDSEGFLTGFSPDNYDNGEWGSEHMQANANFNSPPAVQVSVLENSVMPISAEGYVSQPLMADTSLCNSELPEILTNSIYTPGYLRTQIGNLMKVEFLIGENVSERIGRLVKVGASYIVLQSDEKSETICDLYSIRFVTVINSDVDIFTDNVALI